MNSQLQLGFTFILAAALLFSANTARSQESDASEPRTEIGVIGGSVPRATFTHAVVNREPRDKINQLTTNENHIYFFTELKGMTGQKIRHRWLYQGNAMAELEFNVGAPRWRVWSGKTLQPQWTGTWEVQVIDELDQVVFSDSFEYVKAE